MTDADRAATDPGRERAFCVYCGRVIQHGRACSNHRDLLEVDPLARPARRPLTEQQLGVANPYKVPKHGGREELY